MRKNKLKDLIVEQGVLQALKSLISPVTDAISKFDFPENDRDAERAADWEAIQTNIQKFFEQFPQFTPESEKELDAFEKWLKRNKRIMTPNNTFSMMSKAYMGKGTDVKYASDIQKLLNNLVNVYKDDVFKDTRANEFETITKQALAYSKGELQKAKDYFLNFMLKNLNKISKYKLGVDSKGKEGVEDPVEYNSDLIGRALDLPTSYVATKLKAQLDKIEQAAKYEKEEQYGSAMRDFVNAVLEQYSKEAKVDPKDKQVIAKVKAACEKVVKLDYNLSYEAREARKVALDILFGRKTKESKKDETVSEKATDKLSKMKTALEDVIKKNPPVGKLNKNQLSRLPEIISVALKNNNITEEDELKDVFPKVYPFIVDELNKLK